MLDLLNRKNELKIHAVNSEMFKSFGRLIVNMDTAEIEQAAQAMQPVENGSMYLPSVEAFESLEIAKRIQNECFGTLPTQIGYCWGHSNFLNATEWHTSSEVNIAVTDLVLILGHVWDIVDRRIDSSKFTAFYLPKGTVVEVYATTLHFCPCEVNQNGFGCVVALPVGTNVPLDGQPHDPLLFRQNKWIICHDENRALQERGVVPGISGINFKINY